MGRLLNRKTSKNIHFKIKHYLIRNKQTKINLFLSNVYSFISCIYVETYLTLQENSLEFVDSFKYLDF